MAEGEFIRDELFSEFGRVGEGDYRRVVREQTADRPGMHYGSCPLYTAYIGREIHKEQALLCNPDVAKEDAVACRLEQVLPRGQHRQRARV